MNKKEEMTMKKLSGIVWDMLKVFILFTGCTILFYYGMMWLHKEYEEYRPYDHPKSNVVQVSTSEEVTKDWLSNLMNRLVFFYYNGE